MRRYLRTAAAFTMMLALVMGLTACGSSEPTTTMAPATEATTQAATEATTQAPTTAAPTTEATTEAPTTEATTEAPTTEAPTTQTPTEPETQTGRTIMHDFDPATNKTHVAEGVAFQIPANWIEQNNYFYATMDTADLAMVYYESFSGVGFETLKIPAYTDTYVKSMMAGFGAEGEPERNEFTQIAGREVHWMTTSNTMNGSGVDIQVVTMDSGTPNTLLVFCFMAMQDGQLDYSEDFMRIMENLKDADGTEPATEAQTESSTEQGTSTGRIPSNDFNPETNVRHVVSGIEFQIPANWTAQDPYFYASMDPTDLGMACYVTYDSVSADMLDNQAFIDSFAKGLTSTLSGDAKILRSEMTEVNGRKILRSVVQGLSNDLEVTMDFATMAAPGGKGLLSLNITQSVNGKTDFTPDFEKILENLRDVEN